MKRGAWLTDLHLNFLDPPEIRDFLGTVRRAAPDVILIGGDIGTARSLIGYLQMIEHALQLPVYFVLGNHDFYHGSIQQVRRMVSLLVEQSFYLKWLPGAGVIELGPETALVGHCAWADGRLGDFWYSPVMLNDFLLIKELAGLDRPEQFERLNALGDEAAAYFQQVLPQAFESYRRVILLTHVPPFKEACWHQGAISNDHYLPYFTCQAVGEVLREVMRARPDCQLTVLCGHTHGEGQAQILDNLLVLTGGAEYGKPVVQRIFEIA